MRFFFRLFVIFSLFVFTVGMAGDFCFTSDGDSGRSFGVFISVPAAFASDDEEDNEEEDDEDDEEYEDDKGEYREETRSSKTEQATKTVRVIEYRTVVREVKVTPEEYVRDTDGDGLVDALDPNPSVKQSEYFTDDDGDSVPNVLDAHPGEDDFVFFDDIETDADEDGILDSYQQ